MESPMNLLVAAGFGYLLGSVPFAVIVSRAFRLADPRSFGSGNPGATNVLRSGNKLAALLTLIGDAAKGWLAMFVVARAGAAPAFAGATETAITVAGLAAFLGHVFPFTLGFRGGKGFHDANASKEGALHLGQSALFQMAMGYRSARDDDIDKTIRYDAVIERIRGELATRHFNLLETLGEYVIGLLLNEFGAPWVKIRIAKMGIMKDVRRVGVQIERSRTNGR